MTFPPASPVDPKAIGSRTQPKVLNKRTAGVPSGAIYVGRPSKWGNPFAMKNEADRERVVQQFRQWVCDQPALMIALPELRSHDLVCWCAPLLCHADVLMELANE